LADTPGQPWQITGFAGQAKFGQYLQDAKNPRSISQTEKAVEQEQIPSNEQVLPTPVLGYGSESYIIILFNIFLSSVDRLQF
jgi:hypothetical protein